MDAQVIFLYQLLHLGIMQEHTSGKHIVAMDSSENVVSPEISSILSTVRCLLYSNFGTLINIAAVQLIFLA